MLYGPMWAVQVNTLSQAQVFPKLDVLKHLNLDHKQVVVEPFTHNLEFYPAFTESELDSMNQLNYAPIMPWGSTALVEKAVEQNWNFAFYNENFCVDVWMLHLRDRLLNKDAMLVDWDDLVKIFDQPEIRPHDHWFLRPSKDLKPGPSMVKSTLEVLDLIELAQIGDTSEVSTGVRLNPNIRWAVAPAKCIYEEQRWFIVDNSVISGSVYRQGGKRLDKRLSLDSPEGRTATRLASEWLPHRTCVMDLAVTDSGTSILEFNCLNCSGTYDNDIVAIVLALQLSMVNECPGG